MVKMTILTMRLTTTEQWMDTVWMVPQRLILSRMMDLGRDNGTVDDEDLGGGDVDG